LIFVDGLVSPESIPAGLFVRALVEIMRSVNNARGVPRNCIQALHTIKDPVLSTLKLQCSEPKYASFVDPRPSVAEAWLHAIMGLAETKPTEELAQALLLETFAVFVSLLFYPSLGKAESNRWNDLGMSLDGPHSLALTCFLTLFFRCGLMLQAATMVLEPLMLEDDSVRGFYDDPQFQGIAVIAAALFRACQGALPPWAIESTPEIYSSLYDALGEDAETFGRMLQLSMELRLSHASTGFAGVAPGQLLSGRFFESMSATSKDAFVAEAKQLAKAGGIASWRRLKGLIKAACGGKKKDTHFKQKPSPYKWEFDRV
jgi:hypothetical protein